MRKANSRCSESAPAGNANERRRYRIHRRRIAVDGARVTPAATCWCSARPTAGSGLSYCNSGYEQGLRRVPPDAVAALEHQFDEDERAQLRGEPPRLQRVVNADPSIPASYRTDDAIAFYLQPLPPGAWKNEVTVRSGRLARMYEPGHWAARVSPTPLLMIVALADNITLTDLQLRAFEQTLEPKKLATVEGGHFDPYLKQFPRASAAAVSWFRQHLVAGTHER
jgi:hypothetical protein